MRELLAVLGLLAGSFLSPSLFAAEQHPSTMRALSYPPATAPAEELTEGYHGPLISRDDLFAIALQVARQHGELSPVMWAAWATSTFACESSPGYCGGQTYALGALNWNDPAEGGNGSWDHGIPQFNDVHGDWIDLARARRSAWYALHMAYELYQRQGPTAWAGHSTRAPGSPPAP